MGLNLPDCNDPVLCCDADSCDPLARARIADKIRLQNDKIATGLALEHQRLQRQQSIETEAIRKYQAELKQQALAVEVRDFHWV